VFPVWFVMRLLKIVGRSGSTAVADASSPNREA